MSKPLGSTPVSPSAMVASTDGVRIAVYDFGGPSDASAPVLMFSHATGFHGRTWEPVARRLTARYRCVALDYRGHGQSETPVDANLAWSGMADDAVAVLESELLRQNRVLHGIGHSMGGAALVLAAARRPGMFRSLWLYEPVILPPGGLPVDGAPNPMAETAMRRRSSFPSYEAAYDNFASKPPLRELDPAALRSYVTGGFRPSADGTVRLRCDPDTEAAVFRGATQNGAWDRLPELELPVAVVAGRDEGLGPGTAAPAIVDSLPRAVLLERRHLGHFGPMEDPAAMAADMEEWVESDR